MTGYPCVERRVTLRVTIVLHYLYRLAVAIPAPDRLRLPVILVLAQPLLIYAPAA